MSVDPIQSHLELKPRAPRPQHRTGELPRHMSRCGSSAQTIHFSCKLPIAGCENEK